MLLGYRYFHSIKYGIDLAFFHAQFPFVIKLVTLSNGVSALLFHVEHSGIDHNGTIAGASLAHIRQFIWSGVKACAINPTFNSIQRSPLAGWRPSGVFRIPTNGFQQPCMSVLWAAPYSA